MDGAAWFGHVHVLQFLHEHRREGCSRRAFRDASLSGHVDVVKWLVEHYPQHADAGTTHLQQSGFISLLYSVGPRPLQLCEKHEETPGSVRRVLDEDVQSSVVELSADNLVHTWLRFPPEANEQQQQDQSALHIRLRHLVLVLKNLEQHVSLEVQVADDRGTRRRLRFSTFQKKSAVHPEIALLPLQLDSGWNQVQLDLVELMHTCYNARYAHATSVQLHASCRVRRVYFAEQMFSEAQLPAEFRLYKRLTKEQAQQYREEDRRLQQIQK